MPGAIILVQFRCTIFFISFNLDSFVGFLRLLIFLYTNTLPDGSDGALLEDLMAADRSLHTAISHINIHRLYIPFRRYGVKDMARLCESMLAPSAQNW